MLNKFKKSFISINHNLFLSLLLVAFIPTIYTSLRIFWLGNLPNEYSFSIAGQLSWINLIYEILNEAIILPLFYYIGRALESKDKLTNKLKTGLLLTFCLYTLLSILIISFTYQLLNIMAANINIIDASATYIRIETIANIFFVLCQFAFTGLVALGKDKQIYFITFTKLILCVVLDTFLVSNLNVSFNLGINGIGITNIVINILIFMMILFLLANNALIFLLMKKWIFID